MVSSGVVLRDNPDCSVLQSVIVSVFVEIVVLKLERVTVRQDLSFWAEL